MMIARNCADLFLDLATKWKSGCNKIPFSTSKTTFTKRKNSESSTSSKDLTRSPLLLTKCTTYEWSKTTRIWWGTSIKSIRSTTA